MICGCIDIGSNTTRILVAEAKDGGLSQILEERVFTRLGAELRATGTVSRAKIEQEVAVVAGFLKTADGLGVGPLRTVATAAIRGASNQGELVAALRSQAGIDVHVLTGDEEARLAFLGATRTLGAPLEGDVAVVDVGGGSSEIAFGTLAGGASWTASCSVGSGSLADAYLLSDPPSGDQLEAVRAHAAEALRALELPRPDVGVAVGGSAASLRRLVGGVLDGDTMRQAIGVLCAERAEEIARRFALAPERARLMPAGILILQAAAQLLGCELQVGRGGLREGVCLELAAHAE